MMGNVRACWRRIGLASVKRNLYREQLRFVYWLTGKNKKKIKSYLSGEGEKKLVLGCGYSVLKEWLNSDFHPLSDEVVYLNATHRFPFSDGVFDYIFSEHMIEHISYSDAQQMLGECFRVMKPEGRIRISTPNLEFLFDLYRNDKSPLQEEYIRWSAKEWGVKRQDTHVINFFVREWGHCFIYDEKALRGALEEAGFVEIERCALNESRSPALRNLENETRLQPGFLRLETLTLEGTKPTR
jgi:predicted SAM-dependent methyltransferase